MSQNTLAASLEPRTGMRVLAFGFLYWLTFLLVLEPDNIARAVHAGSHLDWSEEIVRILGASLLGSAVTPVLLEQVRRFPVEGAHWGRRVILQVAGCAMVAAVLIAISCVLAEWFLRSEHRPIGVALGQELIANGFLLAFTVAAFVAVLHAVRLFRQVQGAKAAVSDQPVAFIPVKTRGRLTLVDIDEVDWIESQGNYLALHTGDAVHLIRDSLAAMEARLDPVRFIRIHRGTIVAADRVRSIAPVAAGDANVHLKDGTTLRASRTYRDRIDALKR